MPSPERGAPQPESASKPEVATSNAQLAGDWLERASNDAQKEATQLERELQYRMRAPSLTAESDAGADITDWQISKWEYDEWLDERRALLQTAPKRIKELRQRQEEYKRALKDVRGGDGKVVERYAAYEQARIDEQKRREEAERGTSYEGSKETSREAADVLRLATEETDPERASGRWGWRVGTVVRGDRERGSFVTLFRPSERLVLRITAAAELGKRGGSTVELFEPRSESSTSLKIDNAGVVRYGEKRAGYDVQPMTAADFDRVQELLAGARADVLELSKPLQPGKRLTSEERKAFTLNYLNRYAGSVREKIVRLEQAKDVRLADANTLLIKLEESKRSVERGDDDAIDTSFEDAVEEERRDIEDRYTAKDLRKAAYRGVAREDLDDEDGGSWQPSAELRLQLALIEAGDYSATLAWGENLR